MYFNDPKHGERGFSLIEIVIFLVVFAIGIAGTVTLYGQLTKASVDPVVRKQALALAESMMEEVMLRGFTYCDPNDPNVQTATAADGAPGNCTTLLEAIGPEPGETRYATPRFDNVNDYHGFSMAGVNILDITGAPITGLNDYAVGVTVVQAGADLGIPAAEGLSVVVTATGPLGVSVTLQAYRTRYAPNTP
jgi:MSHA pilin protein MshD